MRMNSWLQQTAACLLNGLNHSDARRRRQRRRNRVPALLSPVFAALESLERRQLLAAADLSVISEADSLGEPVGNPVQVTSLHDVEPHESLNSFTISLKDDSVDPEVCAGDEMFVTAFATFDNPVNSPPVARPDYLFINYSDNQTDFSIAVLSNDSDPDGTLDPQSIEIVTYPEFGSLEIAGDRIFVYARVANSKLTFSYRVRDNNSAY
ncbi:MAG: Ig-like domain-containing protein, partial [Planctomycetota bacterium]